jgi:hypothetical protein
MLSKFFYKFGDITRKFNVPNSWSDVSFKTYYEFIKIVEDGAKPLEVYSLFTGMDKEYWEKDHDPKLFISLDSQLAFLSQLPVAEVPTHLERNDEYYKVPTNFGMIKLGKYRDIVEVVGTIKGDKQSDQLAIYAKMIAVIACDTYDSEEELDDIASDIWQMPCDQVLSLGGFFLKKLTGLKSGTTKKRSLKSLMGSTSKLVLIRLVAIMVTFIACILSPKATLQSIKRYLMRVWLTCTGRHNYRVVSMNRKEYTLI